MGKQRCPAGKKLDILLGICIPSKTTATPGPITEPSLAVVVQLRSTVPAAQANAVMLLSPALWIFVVLGTVGSILALALWLIIYKQQTRHRNTSDDAEQQREPLQKAETPAEVKPPPSETNGQAVMLQRAAWASSACPHLTGSEWEEEGFTAGREPAKHAGTEGGRGLPTCSTMREHRIPLPATDLGGTVLVTTKTV